jgi:hypothetical protein
VQVGYDAETIRQLKARLDGTPQNGVIFFKNCFRPAPVHDAAHPEEANHRLDGDGDHIDLHVADPAGRNPPRYSARCADKIGATVSPHHEIWDGRADQIWFWPLPM